MVQHGSLLRLASTRTRATSTLRSLLPLPLMLLCTVASAAPTDHWDPAAPSKLLQFKLGLGLHGFNAPEENSIKETYPQFAGSIGVQTAFYPVVVEFTFYTLLSMDLAVGAYHPLLVTNAGVLCAGGAALARLESFTKDGSREDNAEMSGTAGVAAFVEWLWAAGYLGAFIEVRQTFLTPTATQVVVGLEVSPMLIYFLRQ